jgi:hypothetical protein
MANSIELICRPLNGGAPKKTTYKIGEAAKADAQSVYAMLVDGKPIPKGTKITRKATSLHFEFPDGTVFDINEWCGVSESKFTELLGSMAYSESKNQFIEIKEVDSGACALTAADGAAGLGALGGGAAGIGALEIAGGIGVLGLIAAAAGGGGAGGGANASGPGAVSGSLAAANAAAAGGGTLTNSNKPSITGKAGAGDKISVKLPGGEELSATADAQGNWSVTPTRALSDGPIAAVVTATSPSGVAGAPITVNFTVDATAPSAPTITAIPENADGYVSGTEAADGTTIQIGLANTSAKEGDTLTVNWGSQKLTQVLTAADIAAGAIAVVIPAATVLAQGNGTVAVTASITDAAGNVGANSSSSAVVALNSPGAAPDLTSANDSGSSSTDNRTNINRPVFESAAAPEGSTTVLIVDGVVVPSQATTVNGVTQLTPVNALADGPHTVAIAFLGANGAQSPASPALNVIIDTTRPATAPTGISLDPASDTGVSNNDTITGDATPSYRVAAPSAGESLRMYVDGVLVAANYDSASGSLTPVTPLTVGLHQISVATVDAAGNEGPRSADQSLTILAVPAAPATAPDMTAATDLGVSNTDNLTASTTPAFTVAAPPSGGSVALFVDGVQVAATYNPVAGTLTPTAAISGGAHSVAYAYTNANGDPGALSAALPITIDGAVATTPTARLATGSDSGTTGDGRTSDTTPDITGTGAPGDSIRVTMPGSNEVLTTTVQPNGTWTVTPLTPLADGTTGNIVVVSTNPAGAASAPINLALAVDNTAPTLSSSSPSDNATNVFPNNTITLTYNENVSLGGSGSITLYNFATGDAVETFNVATGVGSQGGTVSVSGGVVTLSLGSATELGNHYDIQMTAGAVRDVAGNDAAAISTNSALDFTTLTITATNLAKTAYSQFLHTENPNLVNSNLLGQVPGTTSLGNELTQFTNVDDAFTELDIRPAFADGLNWFGTIYGRTFADGGPTTDKIYAGTNGFMTFGHGNQSFTAVGLSGYANGGMIAAQFDDWDNRRANTGITPGGNSQGTNRVYFAAYNNAFGGVVTLTYDDVTPYRQPLPNISDGLSTNNYGLGNAEQIRLVRTQNGDTVIQLVYESVNWINGNNGLPTAGWTKGDQATFGLVDGNIPGTSSGGISGTVNFLDIERSSNVGINGVYEWIIDSSGRVGAGNVPLINTHSSVSQESTQLSASGSVTFSQSATAWDPRFTLVGDKIIVNANSSFAPTETEVNLTVVATSTTSGISINKVVTVELFDQIGGAGNDQIGIRVASDIAKLTSAVSSQVVMNGNQGEDTLIFTGTGLNLNLTTVQDTAILGVERIQMGSGNNVTLSLADIFAMSDANQFNSVNGWLGLGPTVSLEQLVIDGDASDTFTIANSSQWNTTSAGIVSNGGQNYRIYNSTSNLGQLLIDENINLVFG